MHALRVLEFDAVRAQLAEQCETPGGRALALELMPRLEPAGVQFEIERTGEAWDLLAFSPITLRGVRDTRDALIRAEKEGVLDGQSLYWIGQALQVMREAKKPLESRQTEWPKLWLLGSRLPYEARLEDVLLSSLESDGMVKSEASPALASARSRKGSLGQRILERLQSYLGGKTRELLSDPIYTTRNGRYVIPLKAENKGKIKGIVHDSSMSGQTVYVEPEDVLRLGNELREAEAQERAEEEKVLRKLSAEVGKKAAGVRDGLEAAQELDLIVAKARHGSATGGCVPIAEKGSWIQISNGRHPLLDKSVAIPLSLELGRSVDAILITGPNTGGKTISIKTVGLFAAMAQAGLMPPASEVKIGCFTQFWADIGDEQSLQQSLSTFSGHIKNIAEALNQLKPDALVLFDEIGAGTDPQEGAALARALLLQFQRKGAKIMASTHYGELKLFAANEKGFLNASMEFDQKSLRPTYRLMVGTPGSSHALKIASRYGIPADVIEAAEAGYTTQERDIALMIQNLEDSQKRAREAQGRADRLASSLARVEKEAEEKIAQAEETRRKVREQTATELQELLRQIRLEAADIFETVKKDPTQKGIDKAREKLKSLQDVGQEFVREIKPVEKPKPKQPVGKIEKGMSVRVEGFDQNGTVVEDPKGGRAMVQVGMMKMQVKLEQLRVLDQPKTKPRTAKGSSLTFEKTQTVTHEIQLRQMRAEDAELELEKFIDDAVLGGMPLIRIVHGKGEGILRKVTQELLRSHPRVQGFRQGDPHEGGSGVTIAKLK